MIYDFPDSEQPIRQGDIFQKIPLMFFDPGGFDKIQPDPKNPFTASNWLKEFDKESIQAVVSVEPVYGIVLTQDCDTQHRQYIALFLIDRCTEVLGKTPPSQGNLTKWWVDRIVTQTRLEERWFYLPPSIDLGFTEKMAVDFRVVVPVYREFLETNISQLRLGRLNGEADEHFRERVAQYYRRYPYDEWYPLNRDEYEHYLQNRHGNQASEAPPREWQK